MAEAEAEAEDRDGDRDAARRHALNKRVIKPFVEVLLERSGEHNARWLAWYRALRTCVDGKKDDLADALCQAYYHLRDKLWEAAKARAKAVTKKVATKKATKTVPPIAVPVPDAVAALTASSCDLGFKNLAYAVVRVYADGAVADDTLLRGVNLAVVRWERVDCLALAGVPGINVNATNMHRLTEILMCGVAKHADSLFGTVGGEHIDYFLLENQKGGGFSFGGGSNVKTYAASHILQACCMLHYAIKLLPACPAIEFVSSAKKTQDADLLALVSDDEGAPRAKRAKKGEAASIKPAAVGVGGADAGAGAGAGAGATATRGADEDEDDPVRAPMLHERDGAWRAPFTVGTDGIKWKRGHNPDPKKRAAEAARAAKKRARAGAVVQTLADDI